LPKELRDKFGMSTCLLCVFLDSKTSQHVANAGTEAMVSCDGLVSICSYMMHLAQCTGQS
jgi:hypothetical protein